MIDYKDKIKKLLALSTSSCEAEATAALMKARELMAKHKIELGDLEPEKEEDIVSVDLEDITFFSRKDSWLTNIFYTINQFFPVLITASKDYGKKARYPSIAGFKSDVEVVCEIIRYIYDSVYSWAKNYCSNRNIKKGKPMTAARESFGNGFCFGWEQALREQNQNKKEWGLVLAKPDVSSVVNITGMYTPNTSAIESLGVDSFAYCDGYKAGNQFGTQKRLSSERY